MRLLLISGAYPRNQLYFCLWVPEVTAAKTMGATVHDEIVEIMSIDDA
jgi:hypothetical protein